MQLFVDFDYERAGEAAGEADFYHVGIHVHVPRSFDFQLFLDLGKTIVADTGDRISAKPSPSEQRS